MEDHTCSVCGAELPPRRTVVCSKQCRTKRMVESDAYKQARAKYRASDKYKAARAASKAPSRQRSATCPCGQPMVPRNKYCSQSCAAWFRNPPLHGPPTPDHRLRAIERRSSAMHRLSLAATGTHGRTWTAGQCPRCGKHSISWFPNSRAYCSTRCSRLEEKGRRRAREVGARVEPARRWFVFARDDWTCQICGDPVNREAMGTSAMDAPCIDHIVPLAAGGAHAESNMQCAHMWCNSVKSDKPMAEVA